MLFTDPSEHVRIEEFSDVNGQFSPVTNLSSVIRFVICIVIQRSQSATAMKILHPFILQLSKVEVINTYHAKFYIEIPTGRPVILNAKFSFAVPPLLERQMAVNHIESWI